MIHIRMFYLSRALGLPGKLLLGLRACFSGVFFFLFLSATPAVLRRYELTKERGHAGGGRQHRVRLFLLGSCDEAEVSQLLSRCLSLSLSLPLSFLCPARIPRIFRDKCPGQQGENENLF